MAENWTPDTGQVREWYATWPVTSIDTRVVPEHLAEFDRWLAAHDAEVTAGVLLGVADEVHREARWCVEMEMRRQPQRAPERLSVLESALRDLADRHTRTDPEEKR